MLIDLPVDIHKLKSLHRIPAGPQVKIFSSRV